jgi:hypothetical protein
MDQLDVVIAKHGKKEEVSPDKLVVEFLNLAKKFAEECEKGSGNPAYAAGKAVSYFRAAEKLAKVVSPKMLEFPVFATLLKRITPLSNEHREAPKERFHVRRDGDKSILEKVPQDMELPVLEEVEDITPEPPPPPKPANKPFRDANKFNQLVAEMRKLGFSEADSVREGFAIFDENKSIPEMLRRVKR